MSPYLFIICMERLGQLIKLAVEKRRWKPMKLSGRGPWLSHLFFADDLFLFCEASVEQMEYARDILGTFCQISGHKVNLQKSKLFVSRNVNFHRAVEYSNILNVSPYLCVPLLHKRATKVTFFPIVKKVRDRLARWKGKFLSMAGRVVLIKSVLSSLPFYQMQTLLIPKNILNEIEKLSRGFFWNHDQNSRKLHLISWDKIKASKESGGIGIKDLQSQNVAFIMKLCWGLVTKPNAMWVQCLRQKYKCGDGRIPIVRKKARQSAIWGAITTVWEIFLKGIGKKLKDGRSTSAWWDLWTPLDSPLIHFVDRNFADFEPDVNVKYFVTEEGEWNWRLWRHFLPEWVVQKISKVSPPVSTGEDIVTWRPSSDGSFSIKSAYEFVFNKGCLPGTQQWSSLWHWPTSQRIKFFLWQVFQEKLTTNSLRAQRGWSVECECPFECPAEETILHILRDCEVASGLWRLLINPLYYNMFVASDLQGWLKWNEETEVGNPKVARWPWLKVFSLGCWLLWKNRCKKAFENSCESTRSLFHKCLYFLMEQVEDGKLNHKIFKMADRTEARWFRPPVGYIRVDVDGSCRSQNSGACGGVIRDSNGNWIMGFQRQLGFVPTVAAEVLAIQNGL